MRARQRLRFDYTAHGGADTRRDVEPHRLVSWNGRRYLVAWGVGRDDWRTFRLDRCRPVRAPLGPRFVPRQLDDEDAATFVRRGAGQAVWRYRARVRLHLGAEIARARLSRAIEVTPDGPGRCVALVGSDTPHQIALWVGLLDVDFEVLGPPEVAEAFARLSDRDARAVTGPAP